MFLTIACPACGHSCRFPERALGQAVKCSACAQPFQCGSLSPRSLTAIPLPSEKSSEVRETPQARAAEVQATANIHYRCARCQKSLESPAHLAGHKLNCPDCGQRLQIPHASTAPPSETPNAVVPVSRVPSAPRPPVEEEAILTVLPASPATPAAPRQSEYCLECGVEVTQRQRVQTCPDCGSLFCSARCYRDHSYHAHPSRRR